MSSSPPLGHRLQLDSLRAFAVWAVFVEHWLPALCESVRWGHWGLRCFFVLSGFLITGILLRARALAESGATSLGYQFRQFYVRRSLRIFPVYYLTILAGCLIGMETMRSTVGWHLGYASNWLCAVLDTWPATYLTHLWSLSVEEQFYLAWPAVMLLLPRRWLGISVLAMLVVGPLTRWWLAAKLGPGHLAVYVATPSCVDALGAGALMAMVAARGWTWGRGTASGLMLAGVAGGVAMTLAVPVLSVGYQVWMPMAHIAFGVGAVALLARGVGGWCGWLMELPAVQFTGRISYGLYLYHLFCPYVLSMICDKLHVPKPDSAWALAGVYLVMTYAAASLSWWFIERPINALKRCFPHEPPVSARIAAGALPSSEALSA